MGREGLGNIHSDRVMLLYVTLALKDKNYIVEFREIKWNYLIF